MYSQSNFFCYIHPTTALYYGPHLISPYVVDWDYQTVQSFYQSFLLFDDLGEIQTKGVCGPMKMETYQPILQRLEKEGLSAVEEIKLL